MFHARLSDIPSDPRTLQKKFTFSESTFKFLTIYSTFLIIQFYIGGGGGGGVGAILIICVSNLRNLRDQSGEGNKLLPQL